MGDELYLYSVLTSASRQFAPIPFRPDTSGAAAILASERNPEGECVDEFGIEIVPHGACGIDDPVARQELGRAEALPLGWLQALTPPGPAVSLAFVPAVDGFDVDGEEVCGLAVLRPGNTISYRGCHWLLVRHYCPERIPVPHDVAELICSVCGLRLAEGKSVCSCAACGAFFHAEEIADGQDETEILACFSSLQRCHKCSSELNWERRLLPDPSALGF